MPVQFSIVIPTRNRLETLIPSLQTCLNQSFDDYEIVINDNSIGDDTQAYVAQLLATSARARTLVRYFKNDVSVAMTANFELAVERSTGDYVIVLGDDDGMLPRCLEEVSRLIEQSSMKVIKWANALYTWPKLPVDGAADYLGFNLQRSQKVVLGVDCIAECLRTLEYVDLPLLYINAAISRDILDELREKTGRVFFSRSPDVYSGFAIAYICKEFLSTTVPFTVAGLSPNSNGTSNLFGGGNLAPAEDFNALNTQQGYAPHPHVPDLQIYPTPVVAECFLTAKQNLFPDDDRLVLDRSRVLRECAARVDLSVPANVEALRIAADGDPGLLAVIEDAVAQNAAPMAKPRLRPALLGSDGVNLHLDASEFGVTDIEEAVNFIHKIIWPANATLRYDLGTVRDQAASADLTDMHALLIERTEQSAALSRDLIDRTHRLETALHDLAVRTGELSDANARISMLEYRLIQR